MSATVPTQRHRRHEHMNDACFMRECRCGWAGTSARAFNVCDGANTAPQTTRAYAMMRASCESADAVLEGCWDIRPCLECLRRCQHSATDDTSICNDACFMRECRCGVGGCWDICPCLECLRRCQHSATDDTSICNDAWFMRECRCGVGRMLGHPPVP